MKLALPAWFAAIVHVPTVTPLTVLPLMVHMPVVLLENVTALPEAPPVAETVPVPPATNAGAALKVMLWMAEAAPPPPPPPQAASAAISASENRERKLESIFMMTTQRVMETEKITIAVAAAYKSAF